jgi:hypothetical protein
MSEVNYSEIKRCRNRKINSRDASYSTEAQKILTVKISPQLTVELRSGSA